MELWDAYTENELKLDVNLIRGENIPEGLFHAVVQIIVFHKDGTYLLMQRNWNKDKFPGLWEAGASGCVKKGEIFEDGAKRELFEETGIVAHSLKLIDSVTNRDDQAIYKIYLCTCKVDKEAIILQEDETINFKWISRQELINVIDSDCFVAPSRRRLAEYINSTK